jgi:enterochelin esterase-like enzyme
MIAARHPDRPAPGVVLRHPDAGAALAGVRLVPEILLPGELDFRYGDGSWSLPLPPTPARRMEYRLELRRVDGGSELVCDDRNPLRVGGAFGDRSVLEFPGYRKPAWLATPQPPGTRRELEVPAPALGAPVPVSIWSPPGPARGILLVHDGPEYARRAALLRFAAATVASGEVAAFHVALLAAVARDEWYSADPDYTATLAGQVLPALRAELGSGPVVGMGASLGALSLLAAARVDRGAFAGLFLQSGSFFQERLDAQESGWVRYRRVVDFVAGLAGAAPPAGAPTHRTPVAMTCGVVEENLANNRAMAAILGRLGYRVTLREVPDGHNMTAWRDALDPALTGLLRSVWPGGGADTPGDADTPADADTPGDGGPAGA